MSNDGKAGLFDPGHWLRLLLMLVFFVVIFYLAKFVVSIILIVQFVWVAIDGDPNERLLGFSRSLNRYCYQILQYLSFESDEKPFPFDVWPSDNGHDHFGGGGPAQT